MHAPLRNFLAAAALGALSAPLWASACVDCIELDLSRTTTSAHIMEKLRNQLSATHSIFVLSALEGALSSLAETGKLAETIEIAIKRRSSIDHSVQEVKSRRFEIRASDLTLSTSPTFEIAQIAHDGEASDIGFNGAIFRFSFSQNQLRAIP